MAEWHLKELRNAIERSGWRFVAEHPGDNYQVSAEWEFERGVSESKIFVAFEGLDDLTTLPIEKAMVVSFETFLVLHFTLGRGV